MDSSAAVSSKAASLPPTSTSSTMAKIRAMSAATSKARWEAGVRARKLQKELYGSLLPLNKPHPSAAKNPKNPKKTVTFSSVSTCYFGRARSYCSVPSGSDPKSPLGMEWTHFHEEETRVPSSPEDKSRRFSRIGDKQRRELLQEAGIKEDWLDDANLTLLNMQRADVGCKCWGSCKPDTCSCAKDGVECQVRVCRRCNPSSQCSNPEGQVYKSSTLIKLHTKRKLEFLYS